MLGSLIVDVCLAVGGGGGEAEVGEQFGPEKKGIVGLFEPAVQLAGQMVTNDAMSGIVDQVVQLLRVGHVVEQRPGTPGTVSA